MPSSVIGGGYEPTVTGGSPRSSRSYAGPMRRAAGLAVALLLTGVACSSGESHTSGADFAAVTGDEVIDATKRADTATFHTTDVAGAAEASTGADERTSDLAFDFRHNRSRARFALGSMSVEARTIDGTSYVKDGSWLCPDCGTDANPRPALPSDEWIAIAEARGDVAFGLNANAFHGQLAWLQLVHDAVEPGRARELADGTTVTEYRAEVPTADANRAIAKAGPAAAQAPPLQGENVVVTFTIDVQRRLHQLVVRYRVEDRDHTFTATASDLGGDLGIEKPADDEIYRESTEVS